MTTYVRPTHEEGYAKAEAIAVQYGVDPVELRWFASRHMAETIPGLEEIGSSDVSCHLSSLGNYEPEVLEEECQRLAGRDAIVQRVAAASGQSEAEALAGLQALFAPLD